MGRRRRKNAAAAATAAVAVGGGRTRATPTAAALPPPVAAGLHAASGGVAVRARARSRSNAGGAGGARDTPSLRAHRTPPPPPRMRSSSSHSSSPPRWRSRSRAGSEASTESTSLSSANNSSLEIRVSAAVLNVLCCCIIAFMGDNVAHKRADSIFVLALCFLGITWSGPLTLLTGTQMYPGQFSVWQPLEGGVVFVLLQAFGWILYSMGALLCWLVLANYHSLAVEALRGVLTTIVVLSLLSHITLNVSVNYFEVGAPAAIAGRAVFGFLRNGKAFVSALLSVGGAILYLAIDFDVGGASHFAPTLKVIGLACFLVAAFTTHVLEGAYGTRGFRVYQPMVGGTKFVVLQACGWCTFAIFLNLTLAIPSGSHTLGVGGVARGPGGALIVPVPFGYMCLTAMLGFLSQVFLQTSVPQFDPRKRGFGHTQWSNFALMALVAAVLALVFLLVLALDSGHFSVRVLLRYLVPQQLQEQQLQGGEQGEDGSGNSSSTDGNLTPYPHSAVVIGNVILFSCAPYVQVCGWLQKDRFTCVPASTGGATFLLFQAFGWAFYLLAGLMLPLYASMALREGILTVTPIAFASQILVIVSVSQFNPFADAAAEDGGSGSSGALGTRGGMLNERLARFDAHRSSSLLLSIIAAVLMVSLDVLDFLDFQPVQYYLMAARHVSVFRIVVSLSIACNVGAGFLVQLSGSTSYESFQFFQPFRGGVRFVVRQAIGWTVFAVALLAATVLVVTSENEFVLPVYGVYSATGIVGLVGLVVLLLSISFFEDSYVHNPPLRLKLTWTGSDDVSPQEFAAALRQLDAALAANTHSLETGAPGDGSTDLVPLALSLLRDEVEAEAEARRARFTHAVFCLNIPSTQYRTLCFFEVAGLLAAFILFCSAEALKGNPAVTAVAAVAGGSHDRYLDGVFVTAVAFAAAAACLPHLLGGKLRHGGDAYRFYQPFAGGIKFVTLQGIGISLCAIALVGSLTALAVGLAALPMTGALVALGSLWVVGAGLMALSIELFDPRPPSPGRLDTAGRARVRRTDLNHHLVSLIISLSSCVLYVVADIAIFHFGFDESWLRPVLICAWVAAVAAVPLTVLVGRNAVPVGLRSENVLLKIVGWTLWSFTLMLGALLVFNKYFGSSGQDGSLGDGGDDGVREGAVKQAVKLGFQNAGSWLLSTSSLGLLAQLTFALPRFAAMHKVGVDVDADAGGGAGKDTHPASLLHRFLSWAMRSHWANAVMIVGVIAMFSFGDGTVLYAGTFFAGLFVLMLFAFPWRTISTVVQGLCLSVSLPMYFIFIGSVTVAVVVLSILYGCTLLFGFTLQYNSSSASPSGKAAVRSEEEEEEAEEEEGKETTEGKEGVADDSGGARMLEHDEDAGSGSCSRAVQKPYYERNVVGQWLDKALQYFVVGLCSNLQYIHMMQASLTYLLCVGPAATTLTGMADFAFRHFLLGTMPSTMLMAIISTVSKKNDGQLTNLQMCAVVLTLLLPLIDFYRLFTAEPGYFMAGTLGALCINYGQYLVYMMTFIGRPHLMQRRRWTAFMQWTNFWSLLSRYYPNSLHLDCAAPAGAANTKRAPAPHSDGGGTGGGDDESDNEADGSDGVGQQLLRPDGLYVAGWHPHGVLPVTPAWYQFSGAWRTHPQLRHVSLALCSSTINHLVPHMRDMVQWTGGIEVSRTSIRNALAHGISVCIIPGGQSESIESASAARDITLVSRHKGFIRIAIKAGATLLPIFSFGDTTLMDNVNMKSLQRRSKSILGFPFPFVPYGLMNFLPIPRSRPVYVVVGTPIAVEQCDEPTEAAVNEAHARYFAEIRRVFERHKRAAGFGRSKLIYI